MTDEELDEIEARAEVGDIPKLLEEIRALQAKIDTYKVITARVVYTDEITGAEQVEVGDHVLQLGAPGDGYCYGHQSFDCIDSLTGAERVALSES